MRRSYNKLYANDETGNEKGENHHNNKKNESGMP